MLKSLLKLLIGIGLAFVAWEFAAPHFGGTRGKTATQPGDSAGTELGALDEAWECVHQAEQASLGLSAITTSMSPGNSEDVADRLDDARNLIGNAMSQCRCLDLACDLARQALDELEEVVIIYESMSRGDQGGFANPANRRERAVTLLERARGLALR